MSSASTSNPAHFVDFTRISYEDYRKGYDDSMNNEQNRFIDPKKRKLTSNEFLNVPSMTFFEELVPALLLIFGLPGIQIFSFISL